MSWYEGVHQPNLSNVRDQPNEYANISQNHYNLMSFEELPISDYSTQEKYYLNQFQSRDYYLQKRLQMCYFNSSNSEVMQGNPYDTCSQECSANTSTECEYNSYNGSGFSHNMHYNTGLFTSSMQPKPHVNNDPTHNNGLCHQILCDQNSDYTEVSNRSDNFG